MLIVKLTDPENPVWLKNRDEYPKQADRVIAGLTENAGHENDGPNM